MRKIEKVMLLDTRELIVQAGVEFEEYDHYERQALLEIKGFELVHVGRLFGLDANHDDVIEQWGTGADGKSHGLRAEDVHLCLYPGAFDKWEPNAIEGEIDGGVLHLALAWDEGYVERISYNGKFMVWWANEGDQGCTLRRSLRLCS